jgi:hypothetical protein
MVHKRNKQINKDTEVNTTVSPSLPRYCECALLLSGVELTTEELQKSQSRLDIIHHVLGGRALNNVGSSVGPRLGPCLDEAAISITEANAARVLHITRIVGGHRICRHDEL